MHGNLGPNVKTNECDVLIAVGMRFDDRVTGKLETYAKQAKVIHLDIDHSEIDKNVKVDVPVLGNCKHTLAMLTQLIRENKHSEWIDSFAEYEKTEYEHVISKEIHPVDGALNMGEVVRAVSEASNNEAVLVTDVGQNQMMAARYFKYSKNRSIVTSGGLGTMGFGLPAAIGATFGCPDRTVCSYFILTHHYSVFCWRYFSSRWVRYSFTRSKQLVVIATRPERTNCNTHPNPRNSS
jgi:acetolactate synthase I/II/III large subunit